MYVVAKHDIRDQSTAFPRGERLQRGEGAPAGVNVIQFFPSQDGTQVVCLWESETVAAVQRYVDEVLGDSSINTCFPVATEPAFAERALGLATQPLMLR